MKVSDKGLLSLAITGEALYLLTNHKGFAIISLNKLNEIGKEGPKRETDDYLNEPRFCRDKRRKKPRKWIT